MSIILSGIVRKNYLEFRRRLNCMTGINNIPRAIAEDGFRILFSPDRDQDRLMVFAGYGWSISMSMTGMTPDQMMEIA